NSRMPLPSDLPISGRRLGPSTTSAMIITMISWMGDTSGMAKLLWKGCDSLLLGRRSGSVRRQAARGALARLPDLLDRPAARPLDRRIRMAAGGVGGRAHLDPGLGLEAGACDQT